MRRKSSDTGGLANFHWLVAGDGDAAFTAESVVFCFNDTDVIIA